MTISETYLTCCVIGTPSGACAGVDLHETLPGTPFGERLRVYYGADDLVPVACQFALSLLGDGQPSRKGRRQGVSVRHDGAGRSIIGFAIPRHSERADLLAGGAANG